MYNKELLQQAVPVLKDNLDAIHTVAEWAEAIGYSRAHFSVLVKQELNKPPSTIICCEKYKKVRELVHKEPELKGQIIANKTGFINVKSLYKFLKKHHKTTLTEMRKYAKNSF